MCKKGVSHFVSQLLKKFMCKKCVCHFWELLKEFMCRKCVSHVVRIFGRNSCV